MATRATTSFCARSKEAATSSLTGDRGSGPDSSSDVSPPLLDTDAAKSGLSTRSPHRIGQLQDWGQGVQVIADQFDATVLAFEEAQAAGILDRPVEIVTRAVEGLPFHSFARVRAAYQELVDEGCLVVLGPHTSEQLAAMVHDPQRVRVPTLTMAVTTEWHGE